jgi:EAL domain-containing protein (putative c-di-GMP-specific phosphodiesterase class I)
VRSTVEADIVVISTTVEGVETPEQFDFSAAAGCDTIQGYLISRPLDRARLASFISTKPENTRHLVAASS